MEYLGGIDFAVKELDVMGEFEGYASTFKNIDRQGDRVMPQAFTETLSESKGRVPILMGHDTGRIVGFGLSADQDDHGLKVWGQFTIEADEGRNAYALARHAQKVKQPLKMSIGYGVRDGGAKRDEKTGVRTLTAIDLYEYSLVAVPANPRASVTAVKENVEQWSKRDLEKHLRDVGYSEAAAKCIVAAGYDALSAKANGDQRDVDAGIKDAWMAQLASIANDTGLTKFLKEFI